MLASFLRRPLLSAHTMLLCRSILLIPRLPEAWATWMGPIMPPSYFQELYGTDEAAYVDELAAVLARINPGKIYRNYGPSSDSGNFAHPGTRLR